MEPDPPEMITELGEFMHGAEEDLIFRVTLEGKVPRFNCFIYTQDEGGTPWEDGTLGGGAGECPAAQQNDPRVKRLTAELEAARSEVRALQQQMQPQLSHATTDAGTLAAERTRLSEEVTRLRLSLDAAESQRRNVERQLEQRNSELAVAIDNATNLERRLRSTSAVAPSAAGKSTAHAVTVTPAGVELSPDLQQRRAERKRHEADAASPDARMAAALDRYSGVSDFSPSAI
jgi:DNA repair exonuclease SbcCD ATPase subunit